MAPGLAMQGRDHVGIGTGAPDMKSFKRVASAQACWERCRSQGGRRCLAWTWYEAAAVCYTAPWFIVGDRIDGLQSGLHVERIQELRSRCQ